MMINRLYQKAFVGGQWYVALRRKNQEKYNIVKAPAGTWIADPFLCEAEGEHYLFVELYEDAKKKACIGYYKIVDEQPVFQGKIIDQPYHLSYPCVFEYNGEYYMIPESSANKTVDLYRATHFPDKWEREKTLIEKDRYVDTTVFKVNNCLYAISYRKHNREWKLDFYKLDIDEKAVQLLNSKVYGTNVARPAGAFDIEGVRRPAQDCSLKYGESLIIYEVCCSNDGDYDEKAIEKINIKNFPIDMKLNRVHTYNQDSVYECIDAFTEKIEVFHGVKILWRAYLKPYLTKR